MSISSSKSPESVVAAQAARLVVVIIRSVACFKKRISITSSGTPKSPAAQKENSIKGAELPP